MEQYDAKQLEKIAERNLVFLDSFTLNLKMKPSTAFNKYIEEAANDD